MRDISVEESEELPRILAPIAEDAPAAVLGGASALDQAPVDRDLLIMAIEAASPALARLKVGPGLFSSCSPSCLWLVFLPVAKLDDLYLQSEDYADDVEPHRMKCQSLQSIHSGKICLWLHRQELFFA